MKTNQHIRILLCLAAILQCSQGFLYAQSTNTHSGSLLRQSQQYFVANDSSSLSVTGDFSLELWVKLTSLPSNAGEEFALVSKTVEASNQRSFLLQLRKDNRIQLYLNSSGIHAQGQTVTDYMSTAVINSGWINTWKHIAATFKASTKTVQIYVNGTLQGGTYFYRNAGAIFDSSTKLTIGADNEGVNRFANGFVDEVRLWAGVRTSSEISANLSRHVTAAATGLLGCWRLNNSGADLSPYVNTLTAHGGATFTGLDVPFLGDANVSIAPQKIFLAFGQPSSFAVVSTDAFNITWSLNNLFGSHPAASLTLPVQQALRTQIESVFVRSGIQNIDWVSSASNDAIVVFFCQQSDPNLLGKSKGKVDQFNASRRGDVIVFIDESSPLVELAAETAAHEIGHSLGLRHVAPPGAQQEVMDDSFSPSPEFTNAVSAITDHGSSGTHNPLYHLLRYVEGWSPTELVSAGINPGTWDSGFGTWASFIVPGSNLRLYNISISTSRGTIESLETIEQISSASLNELSLRRYFVPQGEELIILASSSEGGPLDVIASRGDPFIASNLGVPVSGTNAPFSLYRQDSSSTATSLVTGSANFDAQSAECQIEAASPSVLKLSFRGTLQTSTDLTSWTDQMGLQSPMLYPIPADGTKMFFRSRQ